MFSDDGAVDDDTRGRRARVVKVNCDDCKKHGCYDDGYGTNQDDKVAAWAYKYTGCVALKEKLLGRSLYASFMCNAHGNGVDIAVFLDSACTIYTNLKSAMKILQRNSNLEIINRTAPAVVYPFNKIVDCGIPVYYPPWGTKYEAVGDSGGVNDMCTELFTDGYSYSLDTCDGSSTRRILTSGNSTSGNSTSDESTEDEKEGLIKSQEDYEFYKYILSSEDSSDDQAVCHLIQDLDGRYCEAINYKVKSSGKYFRYRNRRVLSKCKLGGRTWSLFPRSFSNTQKLVWSAGILTFITMLGVMVYERLVKRFRRGGDRLMADDVDSSGVEKKGEII